MKRFFRRAGCALPDDSRRCGVVLCHSVDGHMPSTTTRRGCWLCVCVVDGLGGMETPGVPSPQRTAGTGRRESQRGSGNVRICVFGFVRKRPTLSKRPICKRRRVFVHAACLPFRVFASAWFQPGRTLVLKARFPFSAQGEAGALVHGTVRK